MTGDIRPLVSIGLPVYNGANYLRTAVETLLAQTYGRFELLISDNASTDETPAICRALAARDERIRIHRNEKNLGAAPNYNIVFGMATGKYFKWAAHDDVLAPTFIERAVDVLEANPDVVLCTARTGRIDPSGQVTGTYPSDPVWADPSPSRRFESLVCTPHACVAVFGLVRRNVLAATPLIAPYVNSDRVLLAELGLHGRIYEIADDLFFRRDHPGSSLRAYPDHRERVVWFDPRKSARFSFPEWQVVAGYAGAVARARLSGVERARCWKTVAAFSAAGWRPLLADIKYAAMGLVARRPA